MNVSQLIAILQSLPANAQIVYDNGASLIPKTINFAVDNVIPSPSRDGEYLSVKVQNYKGPVMQIVKVIWDDPSLAI